MDEQQKNKSLYDSSKKEIFSKHFLAGFSQGLGGFVVTLMSWGVIYLIIVYLLLPQMQTTLSDLKDTLKLIPGSGQTDKTNEGTTIQIPEGLIRQMQRGQ